MELSLAGLLGAIAGAAVGAANYALFIRFAEKSLRGHDRSKSDAEKASFEQRLSLIRRTILAADIVILGGIGYWLASTLAA
jgi:hypothetical protein